VATTTVGTKKKTVAKKTTARITIAQLEKRVIELEKMCDQPKACKPKVTEGASLEKRLFAIEKWVKAMTKK
jgi:hypothetical protein